MSTISTMTRIGLLSSFKSYGENVDEITPSEIATNGAF